MLFLQRDDLAPEIDFLLRWREHAVDDVDVGRLGAAERTEIADVAVLDQEVLKALQIVQRVPVAADRPLHPGRTAVQDDLLTYVERLRALAGPLRSEEHTSELQSLMRRSNAVFCLKKKIKQ